MNYRTIKLSAALVATVASLVGFSSIARAGEGGSAGAAAFTTDGAGAVTGAAVSAAVGKEGAAANSFNYSGTHTSTLQNSASAVGAAGTIELTGVGSPDGVLVETKQDTARDEDQVNTLDGYEVNVGTTSGDTLIDDPGI
ncbi:MAG: hypothetical protein F6K41_24600 [Symploca sp. SIO3E6]|nr:hypothetical protein [Caldora sp. SIO3E6]